MKEYILPFRDLVVNPGLTVPIYIDNPLSVACIEAAAKAGKQVVLTAQHTWGYPSAVDDIYNVGTIGEIAQVLRMPDGSLHAIVRTVSAVRISDITIENGIFMGETTPIEILDDSEFDQTIALRDKIANNIQSMSSSRKIKMDKLRTVVQNYPLPAFVDAVIQMLDIETDVAINILCATTWREKLIILLEQVNLMAETMKIEDSINRRINQQMEKGRREAILQEKMRAIQHEMGETDEEMDAENMRSRIEKSPMSAEAKEKAMSEWRRMRTLSPMSNEGGLLKAYLDELLSMPWGKSDKQ